MLVSVKWPVLQWDEINPLIRPVWTEMSVHSYNEQMCSAARRGARYTIDLLGRS